MPTLSPRLARVVDALPLRREMRVLEIGGAPGAAAREIVRRLAGTGYVLVVDRSARGVALTERASAPEIAAGLLGVRHAAAEDLALGDEQPYDLAFAVRVGALDGRHPEAGRRAVRQIAAMLVPGGRLLVDGGDPLREVPLR